MKKNNKERKKTLPFYLKSKNPSQSRASQVTILEESNLHLMSGLERTMQG